MLLKLLSLIAEPGMKRPIDLARTLGVSPAMVDQMLLDLQRMGYLSGLSSECNSSACASCPAACGPAGPSWWLTAKGRRYLDSHQADSR